MLTTPAIRIGYFSMEIAVKPEFPTYSGGLGVLAGDTLRSAADLGIPIAGVTLLHRKGYFRQRLDAKGQQFEEAEEWSPESKLEEMEPEVTLELEGQAVKVRAWRHCIAGVGGHLVPIYFLDTNVEENSAWARALTDSLYGGDHTYRLCQEAVLGIGGLLMLEAVGHHKISRFHMNEGHSALLALALLEEELRGAEETASHAEALDRVRAKCIFTTHTPVPAAFDQFPAELAARVLGQHCVHAFSETMCCPPGTLNMTYLALRCSRYVNGVAMRHGEISQSMFPEYPIHSITNGVHAATWTSAAFQELYDRHIPEWRRDNLYLRYAVGIGTGEILEAHARAKRELLEAVQRTTGVRLAEDVATIGFARRAAEYKRAELLFTDLERLRSIKKKAGAFQIVMGGKAHPQDEAGKAVIRRIYEAAAALGEEIPVVYVPNYDFAWGRLFTAGVDLWLNTPHRPLEASGTSGMKAALNGVPSLSVRDGWWLEGHFEGITGWSVGEDGGFEDHGAELSSLYGKLEGNILPMFYANREGYAQVMRSTIAVNGSFFNTQRMVSQYLLDAYFPERAGTKIEQQATPAQVRSASHVS
ncbi:MAG TPA: alpha-glucan family phosphorylase [Candidatus Acidoferrum sp.]|nr:alpha-glucan family phosphorylase [Candidatus Acidoferrum sp.]